MIGSQLGNYTITDTIGSGGMGTVYLARHTHLTGRTMAIKVMPEGFAQNPQLVERFKREANVMCSLEHPNIVRVSDFGEDEGFYYFVMEYVEGQSLDKILHPAPEENKPLPFNEAVAIFNQVCDALEYAHSHGVIHRDLKPGNILVRSQKSEVRTEGKSRTSAIRHPASDILVKLTDFGLAKILENVRKSSTGHLTVESGPVAQKTPPGGVTGEPTIQQTPQISFEGQILGTIDYMSPEQKRGKLDIDARSDIFSLGVVLFEMLTGELPTMTPASQLNSSVPKELDIVIAKALRAKPAQRYQNVAEFRKAIHGIIEPLRTQPAPTGALRPRRTQREEPGKGAVEEGGIYPGAERGSLPGGRPSPKVPVAGQVKRKSRVGLIAAVILLLLVIGGVIAAVVALNRYERHKQEQMTETIGEIVMETAGLSDESSEDSFDKPVVSMKAHREAEAKKLWDQAIAARDKRDFETARNKFKEIIDDYPDTALAKSAEAILATLEQKGLLVESEPPGAVITLDGEELAEKTPFLFKDLASGTHKIKVSLEGYVEEEKSFYYSRGEDRREKFALKLKTGDILVQVPEAGFRIRLIGLDHAGQGEEITASGTTHIFKDKRIGRYRVATEHEHYDAFVRELAVKYGERVEMTAQNRPHSGSIHIESEPSDAEIYINDEKKSRGKTPKTIPNLLPGKYKIRLSHPREGDAEGEVIVSSDERANLTIKEFKPRLAAGFRAVESEGRDEKTGLWKEIVHEKSGIILRLVPAGEFDMGSPSGESSWDDDEGPVHRVKISKPFYIGKYEVTQKQWVAIMGNNPSRWKGDNLPVEQVSWNKVKEFCRKAGGGLRLPTEGKWEYACRAGSRTRWCFGDNESTLSEYAWYSKNSGRKTHKVGQKKPNAWGLYDMHGNVWEWCEDVWHDSYNGAPDSGSAWTSGGTQSCRVCRGGSWYYSSRYSRSSNRDWYDPGVTYYGIGFRVVVALHQPPPPPSAPSEGFHAVESEGREDAVEEMKKAGFKKSQAEALAKLFKMKEGGLQKPGHEPKPESNSLEKAIQSALKRGVSQKMIDEIIRICKMIKYPDERIIKELNKVQPKEAPGG